jgi:fucose 4-O-acetylase-like acetyltransferase
MPYVVLALGLSGLIFSAINILTTAFHFHSHLLALWGKNPLLMYLLHMLLLGIVYLPDIPAIYANAPVWLVLLETGILLGALTWVAWRLDQKKIYFSV